MNNRHNRDVSLLDVSPPGETLREMLDERSMSQVELAQRMGRPVKTINEIINGKAAITSETAVELEVVLGASAEFWTAREAAYRNALARAEQSERHARMTEWAAKFPLSRMAKYKWLDLPKDPTLRVKEVLGYFGVSSEEQWKATYESLSVSYKTALAFKSDAHALSAWLRQGELEAARLDLGSYQKAAFLAVLRSARRLTMCDPNVFVPALTDSCAAVGVAIVFVPELPRSHVFGATRWLSADTALIQLSARYKTDGHLWFSFFHEAAHVLLHNKRNVFLEFGESDSAEEQEANTWASDFLIAPDKLRAFLDRGLRSAQHIEAFAHEVGVSPGIVVGRLQYDGILPYHTHTSLFLRYKWAEPTWRSARP